MQKKRVLEWEKLLFANGGATIMLPYSEPPSPLRCVIPVVLVQQQRILCITRTVKRNYILPTSTVRIQLHVSVLYVDHLQVEI